MYIPTAVSSRYTRNLICSGTNQHFIVYAVEECASLADNVKVGNYYEVGIRRKFLVLRYVGVGKTIEEAATNALIKHGVTFK